MEKLIKNIKKYNDISFLKNDVFKHPLEISYQFLENINDVKLTPREIDVLACITSGRTSTKTIASFLSIEPKTVEVYVRNIRIKLGCNSREGIINFIETAKKTLHARNHYLFLLIQSIFEQTLKKIVPFINQKDFSFLIVYEKQYESFIEKLKQYFKCLEIKVLFKFKEENKTLQSFFEGINFQVFNHYFFIASSSHSEQLLKDITPLPQFIESLENVTFISLSEKSKINTLQEMCEIYSITHINFGNHESYYISFFSLLKRLFFDDRVDKLISEFKELCNSAFENSPPIVELNPNLNESLPLPPQKNGEANQANDKKYQNIVSNNFKKIHEKFHIALILFLIILIRDLVIKEENTTFLTTYLQNCSLPFIWFYTLIVCFMAIIILYKKFYIEGLYIYNATVMIIANVYVSHVQLSNLLVISTLLVNNILTEFHGRKITQTNIWFTIYAQLLLVMLVMLIAGYKEQTAVTNYLISILSIKTFTASLLAFMFSQWINILIFEHLPYKSGLLNLWLRIAFSILFIGTIDSFIFEYLDHSLLAKEAAGLNEIITKHVNISYKYQTLFLITSIAICSFFYTRKDYMSQLVARSGKS